MQFQHTAPWIFGVSPHTGAPKTATSRIVKPGEIVFPSSGTIEIVRTGKRVVYAVGTDYAVQPGRGKKAIGRVRITGIERYDVRTITAAQAHAEGFKSPLDFLALWVQMHDKSHWARRSSEFVFWKDGISADTMYRLNQRPTGYYDAWLLTFEPVEVK